MEEDHSSIERDFPLSAIELRLVADGRLRGHHDNTGIWPEVPGHPLVPEHSNRDAWIP
jgi:hypothetical protein